MAFEYQIEYATRNTYEKGLSEAFWQFLIVPENNTTQELVSWNLSNDLGLKNSVSINGLGFKTVQVRSRTLIDHINFSASFKVIKQEINPFDFQLPMGLEEERAMIKSHDYRVDNEPFLRTTILTRLPEKYNTLFVFDVHKSLFENLLELNKWVYEQLFFKPGVTDVDTALEEIIEKRHGVCQDFTHLFCAIAKKNGMPSRYVSGYLHQGNGFFGDSQMHAWAEVHIPNVGWVGFDPTNNILANHNHIKVSHGKDYKDCAPLKGVVYTVGKNETQYSVQVKASQQQ